MRLGSLYNSLNRGQPSSAKSDREEWGISLQKQKENILQTMFPGVATGHTEPIDQATDFSAAYF